MKEDTHVSFLEGELRTALQRVEDLRNVGKMVRGKPDARVAAEALNRRITMLEEEKSRLEEQITELTDQVRSMSVKVEVAKEATESTVAADVLVVIEAVAARREKAAQKVKDTPAAMRGQLDEETRMWGHPFVERVIPEVLRMIEEKIGGEE